MKHAFGKLSAWSGVLDVRMFWKKKEKLGDAHVDAIASTAIETVEMEGLLIGLPGSVASEDQVTCLEAYGRGLLDAFTLGVMHGAGMLDLSAYEHIDMTQRLKNVHTEVLYAAKSKFVSSPRVAAIFSPIYEKVGLQWDPHKLFVRLDAAVLQKNSFFQIGIEDALFQVEIAKTGYLEPTRNLLKNWFNSNQSCDLVARVGGVTTEKNTLKDIEGDGISLRKAASIIDGRFNFDFSFQNNCMELNFEATTSMPNNFDPCHPKKEEGFLRIEREYEGDYQISFLLAPYDMISDANELEEIENISGYGINALLFSLHAQDSTQEFLLLVEPEEISEEGWYYNRHSPSGLPFDLKIAQQGHPIKRFLRRAVSAVAETTRIGRIEPRLLAVLARRPYFSGRRIDLSSRFRSVFGVRIALRRMTVALAVDEWR